MQVLTKYIIWNTQMHHIASSIEIVFFTNQRSTRIYKYTPAFTVCLQNTTETCSDFLWQGARAV